MFSIHQLLIFAARSGNLGLMHQRIKAGADVLYYDEKYGAALFEAIRCHHSPAVALLLQSGADVQMRDPHDQGPLEYALSFQDDAIVSLLLQAGARLRRHALPHFKSMLSEHLKRTAIRKDTTTA